MRIIVTAAGGSGGRFLTEALRMAGHYVIGTDCDSWQLPLAIANERHLVPKAGDGFAEAIERLSEKVRADLVMPQSDPEVLLLAEHQRLPGKARFFLPAPGAVHAAQDKWENYRIWTLADIPTPKLMNVNLCQKEPWPQSVWIRPSRGHGAAKALKTNRASVAIAWAAEHRGHFQEAGAKSLGWDHWLMQEFVEGTNCVADLVFWRGRLVAWAGREVRAWQMAHCSPTGVTGASRVTILHLEEPLREIAEAAVRALPGEPHGVFGVDTIRKEDGTYWVTEVNAGRFNAPGPALYARAGLNLAAVAVQLSDLRITDAWPVLTGEEGKAWAMLRGQDTPPVYLTRAEWEELCGSQSGA